jgi:hypothetical protein
MLFHQPDTNISPSYTSSLKAAVIGLFQPNSPEYNASNIPKNIIARKLLGDHRKLMAFITTAQKSGKNLFEDINLSFATTEVFGWRRPIINHENESGWQDGKPPIESALLIWNNRCFPHNHSCNAASYCVLESYPDSPNVMYEDKEVKAGSVFTPSGKELLQSIPILSEKII